MPERVFIDTGFFKALVDSNDDFYQRAMKIWQNLGEKKIELITSNFVIDETLTIVRVKCGLEKTFKFRDLLAENSQIIKIVRVTVDDEAKAWQWFVNKWSKLSFTDCVSFAVMKRWGLRRVAAFDEHFKRAGFSLEY
ncbi:MAG: PIN domain-containing protein [Patescibacteria group bacterium]|nr:PIN domain-containing protein [Patescibacteria group bacterium]